MDITPASMAAVTFTLLDALFSRLIEKGILTKEDQIAIYQGAHFSLKSSEDQQMRDAVALLEHLYKAA
jgi:hypothetical protein